MSDFISTTHSCDSVGVDWPSYWHQINDRSGKMSGSLWVQGHCTTSKSGSQLRLGTEVQSSKTELQQQPNEFCPNKTTITSPMADFTAEAKVDLEGQPQSAIIDLQADLCNEVFFAVLIGIISAQYARICLKGLICVFQFGRYVGLR